MCFVSNTSTIFEPQKKCVFQNIDGQSLKQISTFTVVVRARKYNNHTVNRFL